MEAYPFMWAKNKQISDWCCVAQPEFLRSLPRDARAVLLGAQRGVSLGPNEIEIVRREYSGVGVLDIAYRKVPSGLTDRAGRPFDFIEGVVLRGRNPDVPFAASHFDEARKAMQGHYEAFATAARWGDAEAYHSDKIDLRATTGEAHLKIRETVMPSVSQTVAADADRLAHSTGNVSNLMKGKHAPLLGRTTIICGAVACVAIGGFLLAEHIRRQRRSATREPAIAGN